MNLTRHHPLFTRDICPKNSVRLGNDNEAPTSTQTPHLALTLPWENAPGASHREKGKFDAFEILLQVVFPRNLTHRYMLIVVYREETAGMMVLRPFQHGNSRQYAILGSSRSVFWNLSTLYFFIVPPVVNNVGWYHPSCCFQLRSSQCNPGEMPSYSVKACVYLPMKKHVFMDLRRFGCWDDNIRSLGNPDFPR